MDEARFERKDLQEGTVSDDSVIKGRVSICYKPREEGRNTRRPEGQKEAVNDGRHSPEACFRSILKKESGSSGAVEEGGMHPETLHTAVPFEE